MRRSLQRSFFFLLAMAALLPGQKLSFEAPHIIPTPGGLLPYAMIAGDFNGDGHQDLAILDGCDCPPPGHLQIMLGDGHGGFTPGASYPFETLGGVLIAADFNRDGHVDLALFTQSNAITILLGNGDGTFQAPGNAYPSGSFSSVSTADFNGDGAPDLLLSVPGGLSLLLNHGDGTFGSPVSIASGNALSNPVTGDFNGDGKIDLIANNSTTNSISFLAGNGDGTFQAPTLIVGQQLVEAAADFNGDGHLDLLLLTEGSPSTVFVLLGNGDGTFQPAHSTSGEFFPPLFVADFNQDGKPDLAWYREDPDHYGQSGNMFVVRGNGDGSFQSPVQSYASGGSDGITDDPFCFTLGDFNEDHIPDFAGCHDMLHALTEYGGPGAAVILLGRGDGTFVSSQLFVIKPNTCCDGASALLAGDFDGDGKADLALLEPPTVAVRLSGGKGSFTHSVRSRVGNATAFAAADFNGDGHLDIAAIIPTNKQVAILLGIGNGSFQPPKLYPVRGVVSGIAAGDLNGDGRPDLVLSERGSISVLLNNGDGSFQTPHATLVGGAPLSVAIGDFSRDGIADVAVVTGAPGTLVMLLGKGDGTFQPPRLQALDGADPRIAVGDFNGDGNLDLAVATIRDKGIALWFGRGDGTFRHANDYPAVAAPGAPVVADFNGDGILDIAAPCELDLLVMRGKGNGRFDPPEYFSPGPVGAGILVSGDFKGNGKAGLAAITGNPYTDHTDLYIVNNATK